MPNDTREIVLELEAQVSLYGSHLLAPRMVAACSIASPKLFMSSFPSHAADSAATGFPLRPLTLRQPRVVGKQTLRRRRPKVTQRGVLKDWLVPREQHRSEFSRRGHNESISRVSVKVAGKT